MQKRICLASHYDGKFGGLNNLINFLEPNHNLSIILHPLDKHSAIPTKIIRRGRSTTFKRRKLGVFSYIVDIIISFNFVLKNDFESFIAASNIDALPFIMYKKVFRAKHVRIIYYPRDYSPHRFLNRGLNHIYTMVERIAVRHSDFTISNTYRSQDARIQLGLTKGKSLVIPNPVNIEKNEIKRKSIDKTKFIYVGDVSKEHGLFEIVKVLSKHISQLDVIGTGPDLARLKSMTLKDQISTNFHGDLNHEETIKILINHNGIGLAPYNNISEWTHYCSPLKVGEYISCGLPVIVSNVPEVSKTIGSYDLGVVYSSLNYRHISTRLNQFNTKKFYQRSIKFYYKNNMQALFGKIEL